MDIVDLIRESHETSRSKGWWDEDADVAAVKKHVEAHGMPEEVLGSIQRLVGKTSGRSKIPEKLVLIHSEISEALEEYRSGKPDIYYPGCEVCQDPRKLHVGIYHDHSGKPEGLAVELADALIRVFDLCGAFDVPLAEALEIKMAYNKTRPHRHGGKVC